MKYHYVYRITNIKENKYYYGVRSSKCLPKDDLGIKYFSSASDKEFIKDQKCYPNNFCYKVVSIHPTRKEAALKEIKLHEKFNVAVNENFYNLAKHTSTGFDVTGRHWTWTKESKLKMSKSQTGKNNNAYGREYTDEEKRRISERTSGEGNGMYGKKHSKESKLKMHTTAKLTNKGVGEKNSMFGSNRTGAENPFFGKKHSVNAKQKMSERKKGKYIGTKKYINEDNIVIQCFENDERLKVGQWKRGIKWI